MFDRFRRQIGVLFARVHFREPDKVQTFTDAVKRARSAMVILPAQPGHSQLTGPLLHFIQTRFRGNNLTVIVPEESRSIGDQLHHCDIIRIGRDDVGAFALPKKEILRRVRRNKYDLALDLNMDFSLTAAYLCKASRSRLRVGFVTKYADTFYNFQIKTDAARNISTTYERVADCLGMF